uniref:Secreted protein n=1 Tax=Anopheles darlingi TaxID=43151 RepID=A0A2M4DNM9_ANODA
MVGRLCGARRSVLLFLLLFTASLGGRRGKHRRSWCTTVVVCLLPFFFSLLGCDYRRGDTVVVFSACDAHCLADKIILSRSRRWVGVRWYVITPYQSDSG